MCLQHPAVNPGAGLVAWTGYSRPRLNILMIRSRAPMPVKQCALGAGPCGCLRRVLATHPESPDSTIDIGPTGRQAHEGMFQAAGIVAMRGRTDPAGAAAVTGPALDAGSQRSMISYPAGSDAYDDAANETPFPYHM